VYAGGRAFVGWVDWKRNIVIAAVGPHGTQQARIGTEDDPATGKPLGPGQHDDHGNPALLAEPDGRITVYYSGHGGPDMHVRTTVEPGDIRSWGPDRKLPTNVPGPAGYAYPNPVRLASEARTYLFWRGGTSQPTFSSVGADGVWSPARVFIDEGSRRPYLKVASNGRDAIDFAFTNGHPRSDVTNIYFAAYRRGALYRADGTRIGSLGSQPLRTSAADEVYDARRGHARAWIWDVAIGRDGRPVIVYAVFHDGGRRHGYRYARFTGKRWENHALGDAGGPITVWSERFYSGGVTLDHQDPRVVYASVEVDGHHEIRRLVTRNGGASWRRDWITYGSSTDNVRPFVAVGAPDGERALFWMHGFYNVWADFRTSIAGLR
jgi:hypothetical protein